MLLCYYRIRELQRTPQVINIYRHIELSFDNLPPLAQQIPHWIFLRSFIKFSIFPPSKNRKFATCFTLLHLAETVKKTFTRFYLRIMSMAYECSCRFFIDSNTWWLKRDANFIETGSKMIKIENKIVESARKNFPPGKIVNSFQLPKRFCVFYGEIINKSSDNCAWRLIESNSPWS